MLDGPEQVAALCEELDASVDMTADGQPAVTLPRNGLDVALQPRRSLRISAMARPVRSLDVRTSVVRALAVLTCSSEQSALPVVPLYHICTPSTLNYLVPAEQLPRIDIERLLARVYLRSSAATHDAHQLSSMIRLTCVLQASGGLPEMSHGQAEEGKHGPFALSADAAAARRAAVEQAQQEAAMLKQQQWAQVRDSPAVLSLPTGLLESLTSGQERG